MIIVFAKQKNKSWQRSSTDKWLTDGERPICNHYLASILQHKHSKCPSDFTVCTLTLPDKQTTASHHTHFSTDCTRASQWSTIQAGEAFIALVPRQKEKEEKKASDVKVCHQMVVGNLSCYSW